MHFVILIASQERKYQIVGKQKIFKTIFRA